MRGANPLASLVPDKKISKIGLRYVIPLSKNLFEKTTKCHEVQCLLLNRINFGQHKIDNNNLRIQFYTFLGIVQTFNGRAIYYI